MLQKFNKDGSLSDESPGLMVSDNGRAFYWLYVRKKMKHNHTVSILFMHRKPAKYKNVTVRKIKRWWKPKVTDIRAVLQGNRHLIKLNEN